jgi:excisionase family DNA binding protein
MRESPYMTLEEAAAYIHQKPETLERWAKDGFMDYYKTPGGKVFTADMLDRFMAQRLHIAVHKGLRCSA